MNTTATDSEQPDKFETDSNSTRPLWERLPDESTSAWTAFQRYRDLGPRRSLDAVDRELSPATAPGPASGTRHPSARRRRNGCVSDWSRRHRWVARAAAWDAELDRQSRITHVEAVREMAARHARAARALQARAIEALRSLPAADMAAADVLRFLVEACKLERLAVGEPTERTAQEISGGSPVVLEVVERIVPVRGGDLPATGAVAVATRLLSASPVPSDTASAATADDTDVFALPDEPPEFMRRSST